MRGERVLSVSHGHPDLIRGGGEIAAYNLHRTYTARDDVDAAWFLARADLGNGATGRMTRHRPDEYLWEQSLSRAFTMQAANLDEVTGYFADLVRALRPTVVHAHHFFNLGLEYLKAVKDVDPAIRLVLTLHEYIAICPNAGLMMKPETFELCRSGRYDDHLGCATGADADDLWLRKHRFDGYFRYVDHFVAPSAFLRERYIEWGIPPERITVLRNGQPRRDRLPARPLGCEGRNRFGFFGQINAHKGLDVMLDGLRRLAPEDRRRLRLDVNGANLEYQPRAFRERIGRLVAPLIEDGVVHWRGAYSGDQLPERMAAVDWVVVPSIWYENAPLTIQEAFSLGRPVVATNLGGMAEAVEDGTTGVLLPRGDGDAWAARMLSLSEDGATWDQLAAGLPVPLPLEASAEEHLALFQSLQAVPA